MIKNKNQLSEGFKMVNFEKRPMLAEENKYSFSQNAQIYAQTGLIGHLWADLDTDGSGFFSDWSDWRRDLKTDEFKAEFDDIINALRKEGEILHSKNDLAYYCYSTPESKMQGEGEYYGVRIDTEKYAYLVRLNPNGGYHNVHVYCYVKNWLDINIKKARAGIRFVDENYNEIFRIPDGGKIKIRFAWGAEEMQTCRYIDDTHFIARDAIFHIAEFEEKMRVNGHTCEPVRETLPQK